MVDDDEMRPLDISELERISKAIRFAAQSASAEQLEAMGFLPETAQAIVLVRACFSGAWW